MATATLVCARAKSVDGVAIERYKMERSGDSLRIDIRLNTAELNIKSRQVAVITPAIVKNNERVELRSCGIYSRMRDIYYTRNEHLAPTKESDMRYRKRRVPEFIDYALNLPYTDWMDHSSLVLCHKGYGCCGAELWNEADTLVEQFPRDIYTPQMLYLRPKVEVVKTRALKGTAYIDFPVSRMEIYPTYHNNAYELNKIIGTIDSVKNDKDITIKHLAPTMPALHAAVPSRSSSMLSRCTTLARVSSRPHSSLRIGRVLRPMSLSQTLSIRPRFWQRYALSASQTTKSGLSRKIGLKITVSFWITATLCCAVRTIA